MLWQGALQSLAPLVGAAGTLWYLHRRQVADPEGEWLDPVGRDGVGLFVVVSLCMWVLPGGILLAVPLAIGVSLVSPAGREAWREHRTPRMLTVGVAVLFLTASGLLPVDSPVAPEDWGQPLFTENPHAPPFPASEQYTWLTNDVVVLQSLRLRLPHQTGVMGAEWTALTLASVINMETSRMHQAIQLIDNELPFTLDPNDVVLELIPAPSTIDVRVESTNLLSVEYRRYDVKTTAIGLDPSGTKVGEVVAVARASWGGHLDMLIIVRPIAHPTLEDDGRGEAWIRPWLLASGA
jgi:hypothetical protein